MTIAYVQDTGGGYATSGSNDLTFGSTPSSSNMIIALQTGHDNYAGRVCSDNKGNTYTNDYSYQETGYVGWWASIWSKNLPTSSSTFTVSNRAGGMTENFACVIEVSGQKTSSAFDKSGQNTGTLCNANRSATSGTLTQADEFCVMCSTGRVTLNAPSAFVNPTSPWTIPTSSSRLGNGSVSNSPAVLAYQVVASTSSVSATVNITAATPTTDLGVIIIGTYMGAGGGSAVTHKLLTLGVG